MLQLITVARKMKEPYKWSVSSGKLPNGLGIKASGDLGVVSGTPKESGQYTFTLNVTDSNGMTASKTVNMTVTRPAITGMLSNAIVKTECSNIIRAMGGTEPYVWSISSGKLPDGLNLKVLGDASADISGIPTKKGTYKFTIKATDKNNVSVTKSYTMKITQTAISGKLSNGVINAEYYGTLIASQGTPDYTWSISKGTLPNGLKINSSNGKITGKPTKAGTFNFTVKVADKNGVASSKAYTVTITQTTLSGTIPANGVRKVSYTATQKATGGTSPYTWSISKGTLPNGLKINTSNGKITGKPTKAGTFSFTVKVADKNGVASSKAFKVQIIDSTQQKAETSKQNPISQNNTDMIETLNTPITNETIKTQTIMDNDNVNGVIVPATLNVASHDIVEAYEGKDSDLVKVNANKDLTFVMGEWGVEVSYLTVYVDDKAMNDLTVSDGRFSLPAEMVNGDFKVCVKAKINEGLEIETEEIFVIAE